jgi:chromosome segregation and condensation protein ScpB
MDKFTLEAAQLINHATSLLSCAGIYSDETRKEAAAYIKREWTQSPNMEPQEQTLMLAVIAFLETN